MKKLPLLILFIFAVTFSYGQRGFSLPFSSVYDEDAPILLGLQYNYVNQNYILGLKKGWQEQTIDYSGDNINDLGELQGIRSKTGTGFSVSIPVDFRANENLYFTFSPSFLFINHLGIEYTSVDETKEPLLRKTRHIQTSTSGSNFNAFEFPFNIKFRSDEKILKNKFNRYRGYVTGGARYSRWIGINGEYNALLKESSDIAQSIILKPGYLSWEFGIGADIFFPYFKMSPEIKFNQSFKSVLDHQHPLATGNQFMDPLEKGLIRNIYLSVIFQ
ncbi:PorT [Sphingobacterium olei]|uniref:PorT n=1 Tax=Sphingobacterium olei TaxID=2571155 RepID=A0A4V5MPW2_9SPHI|nr:PorT [Sphingobacterium olei]TJZ62758.1 PorT [Sphingobacterium olei]